MKFLIVDDNTEMREYLRDLIVRDGDVCIELDDGKDVNMVYKNTFPDWVILDLQMKQVNGFRAAEKLKKNFPHSRFVIVSNYTDIPYRQKALQLGAVAFISKENLFDLYTLIYGKQDNIFKKD